MSEPAIDRNGPDFVDLICLEQIATYGEEFCDRMFGMKIVDGHVQISTSRRPIEYKRVPDEEIAGA